MIEYGTLTPFKARFGFRRRKVYGYTVNHAIEQMPNRRTQNHLVCEQTLNHLAKVA